MKYTCEITIGKPVDTVVSLFDNPDHLPKWMDGLQSFEPISGTPGQPGAKSRLRFRQGNRDMELIETITKRDLPDEFSGTYEAKGLVNHITNRFIPVGPDKTKYISEVEFQFSGIMKLFGLLMPGMFRKQSMRYMNAFKHFVESHKE